MIEKTIFLQLKELAAKHSSCPIETISLDSRIGEDLRIVGDDAEEFLEEFSSLFGVDMTSMNFDEYFPSEASSNMHYYLSFIAGNKSKNKILVFLRFVESNFWRIFATKKSFKTMTIKNLMDAIEKKKWH